MATVKIPGLKPFAQRLKSIEKQVSNTKRLHGEAVVLYEQWVKRNFDKEGKDHDQSSLHWKKLHPATLKKRRTRKRSPNTSKNILKDNGQLRQRWFRHITEKQAEFKSGQDYSSVHENGGRSFLEDEKIWINVPRRKIFPVEKQARKIIRPALKRHLQRAFGGRGKISFGI